MSDNFDYLRDRDVEYVVEVRLRDDEDHRWHTLYRTYRLNEAIAVMESMLSLLRNFQTYQKIVELQFKQYNRMEGHETYGDHI